MVHLTDYPQLNLIAWNLPGVSELEEREAFELYESNWKWVDQATLTPEEQAFIEYLTRTYGGGLLNV